MRPGAAALCPGTVRHRRTRPQVHAFEEPVAYVWLDPDRPDEITDRHPLWSSRRPAPVRFRRRDYGPPDDASSLGDQVRTELERVTGRRPDGPVRMLTQLRTWGWLFNPITVYVAWDRDDPDRPVGAVLEVTSTPWKQRVRYATALETAVDGALTATVDKVMHVSPFLDEDAVYDLRILNGGRPGSGPDSLRIAIDVRPGDGSEQPPADPILCTALEVDRVPATRRAMTRRLRRFPTHRVSIGIHREAARLWAKRVPFVPHPSKRAMT